MGRRISHQHLLLIRKIVRQEQIGVWFDAFEVTPQGERRAGSRSDGTNRHSRAVTEGYGNGRWLIREKHLRRSRRRGADLQSLESLRSAGESEATSHTALCRPASQAPVVPALGEPHGSKQRLFECGQPRIFRRNVSSVLFVPSDDHQSSPTAAAAARSMSGLEEAAVPATDTVSYRRSPCSTDRIR